MGMCVCVGLMSLGVRLKQELGDEFGGDFGEFDKFGVAFAVCLLHLGMREIWAAVVDVAIEEPQRNRGRER